MVSKLSILKTYYHLPLEDQFSFTYEDEHYYLTNKPFAPYEEAEKFLRKLAVGEPYNEFINSLLRPYMS